MGERSASNVVRSAIAAMLLWSSLLTAAGQERVCVAFWNVESLYDTIPSPFYDDREFTPSGKYRWDSERYGRKTGNLARVINDLGADLLGLAEVENEGVIRDLAAKLGDDYNYVHRTSGDRRGMDVALLYKGDKFWPERVQLLSSPSPRGFLLVRGELLEEPVSILLCHLPSGSAKTAYRRAAMEALAFTADSLLRNDPGRKLILMGDFNADPSEKVFYDAFGKRDASGFLDRSRFYAPLPGPASGGSGYFVHRGRWTLPDNILLSYGFMSDAGVVFVSGGVFVRGYMLGDGKGGAVEARGGYPFRTANYGRYAGGFSSHLPVFVVLSR